MAVDEKTTDDYEAVEAHGSIDLAVGFVVGMNLAAVQNCVACLTENE